jgi:hypothetical protein
MPTIRLLRRTPVNPGGVSLGDFYEVLIERYSGLVALGDKILSMGIDCPLVLDSCDDLRIELELETGVKIQRRIEVLSTANRLLIARSIE